MVDEYKNDPDKRKTESFQSKSFDRFNLSFCPTASQ